jgi:hypothetical protein
MIFRLAKACTTMTKLRDRAAALEGKHPVQLRFYLPTLGAFLGGLAEFSIDFSTDHLHLACRNIHDALGPLVKTERA